MIDSNDQSITSLISVGRGALFFGAGRITSQVLSFLILFLLTDFLGPTKYGVYSFGLTIVAIIGSVANIGSDKANLRFIPANPSSQSSYLSVSYLIGLIGGGGAGILLFVFAPLVNDYTLQNSAFVFTLRIFIILLLARVLFQLTATAFRALDLPEFDALFQQLLLPICKLLIIIAIILLFGSYESLILGLVIIEAGVVLLSVYCLLTKTSLNLQWPKGLSMSEYLSFSLPASIKDTSALLFTQIDIFMIGFFVAAADVGIYRVAIMLGTVVSLPLAGVNRIFPSISSKIYHNDDKTELNNVFDNVTRWVVILTSPILLVSIIYRFEILRLLGSGFVEGATIFAVIITARFLWSTTGVISELLLMADNQNVVTANQVVFGSLNIILNFILIPRHGLFGAALATITSLSLVSIARVAEILVLESMSPYTIDILRILPAVIGMATALTAIQWVTSGILTLVIGGSFGGLTYLFLLYRFGTTEDDKRLYETVKNNNSLIKSISGVLSI